MSALHSAETVSWARVRETMQSRARELAAAGADQNSIMATLQAEFPGLPAERYYLNPAAIAVMERVRREQKEHERAAANREWRRQRGLPEMTAAVKRPQSLAAVNPLGGPRWVATAQDTARSLHFVGPDDY
jgi:hypothetical protein